MKQLKTLTTLLACIALMTVPAAITGCALLASHAAPTSEPVASGVASTNDYASVAWLKLAQTINTAGNPTSTTGPINTVLGSLIVLFGAIGGFAARHVAGAQGATAQSQAVQLGHALGTQAAPSTSPPGGPSAGTTAAQQGPAAKSAAT